MNLSERSVDKELFSGTKCKKIHSNLSLHSKLEL